MIETQTAPAYNPLRFKEVLYRGLTPDELRSSNYLDNKLDSISIDGNNVNTNYDYSLWFIRQHPNRPYLKLDTGLRKDFLTKGTEKHADDALKELGLNIRRRTGGFFEIHPFYGAVYGTHFNPILDNFCKGQADDKLSIIIFLTDQGKSFGRSLTREAVEIGTTISFLGPYAQRYIDYMKRVNLHNPNQGNRDQAIANGLGEKWDAEFFRFNPQARNFSLGGLLKRLVGFGRDEVKVSHAMEITQRNVANFMDYINTELGFRDVSLSRARYKDITHKEWESSTLPKDKVVEVE